MSCNAFYCLPISDVELMLDTFLLSIDVKGYKESIESTIQITVIYDIISGETYRLVLGEYDG